MEIIKSEHQERGFWLTAALVISHLMTRWTVCVCVGGGVGWMERWKALSGMSGSVPMLNESAYLAIGQLNDFSWDVG